VQSETEGSSKDVVSLTVLSEQWGEVDEREKGGG